MGKVVAGTSGARSVPRYGLSVAPSKLQERFESSNTLSEIQPRYNITPTQELPMIVRNSPE